MQRVPDPYRALGVGRDATIAEVKAAHRRLAKRYHPDAPHADEARFLAVQDAYELLRDPLSRREWDRMHAPGPVRAEPATTGSRRRGTAAASGPDRPESATSPRRRRRRPAGADATFGPNDRPPQADSWTWTAEGVPWWEDGGAPRSRRAARRRSAAGTADRPPAASTGGPPDPAETADPGPAAPGTTASAEQGAGDARTEADVFSRSSGAAWSSASRAYFRRRAADMPSGAANPNTPRWTTPVGAPAPRRYEAPAPPTGDRGRAMPHPADVPHGPPRASPSASQPIGSSRSLGAALAAIFRRGDR